MKSIFMDKQEPNQIFVWSSKRPYVFMSQIHSLNVLKVNVLWNMHVTFFGDSMALDIMYETY